MSTYKFKFRRRFFWKTYTVIGHNYEEPLDQMVLYFPDGGLLTLRKWGQCQLKLGADWVAAQKKNMESKAGQSIPLNVGA